MKDTELAEGAFAVIAYRVHRDGQPYPGGTWLRETAGTSEAVCEECGLLPPLPELPGWTTDWMVLAQEARDHARDTGHRVAVQQWQGALYGPERKENEA